MAWSKIYSQSRFWLKQKTALLEEQTQKIFSLFNHKDAPFPHTTVLYDQAIRSLIIWGIGIGTILIFIVVFSGSSLWKGYQERQDLKAVIAAAKNLELPKILEARDLKTIFIPQQFLPEGASDTLGDFIGKSLIFPMNEHEIILEKNVHPEAHPDSVSTLFTENYAMALDQSWFSSGFPEVYKNDWVDVLVYKPFSEEQDSEILIQKARVLQVENSRGKSSITLNLTQDQSQSLFFAHSLRMPLQIVVHASSSF